MIWTLSGFLGSPSDWDFLQPAFADTSMRFRGLDLFEESSHESLWDRARDLVATIREEDPSPKLLAYSLGARVALHMLLLEPELFTHCVLVSPHLGLHENSERLERATRDEEWAKRLESALGSAGAWEKFMNDWNSQPVLVTRQVSPISRQANPNYLWGLREGSLSRQDFLLPRVHEIRSRALWVAGAEDLKFTDQATQAARQHPPSRLCVIEGAGHRAPWQRSEAFAALTRGFLVAGS